MSQHPSLRSASKGRQHRSVFKRFERIKLLMTDEKWTPEESVFGLPKIRSIKVKSGKSKAVQAPETAAQTAEAAASTATTAPAAAVAAEKTKGPDTAKQDKAAKTKGK